MNFAGMLAQIAGQTLAYEIDKRVMDAYARHVGMPVPLSTIIDWGHRLVGPDWVEYYWMEQPVIRVTRLTPEVDLDAIVMPAASVRFEYLGAN